MKNISQWYLIVASAISIALLYDIYLNGYERLQNLNEILQLQPFWIHLVIVLYCVTTHFFGLWMCLLNVVGILLVPNISCKKRLLVTLIVLCHFFSAGLGLAWIELAWIPCILVDFISCITRSMLTLSLLFIMGYVIILISQRARYLNVHSISSRNISQNLKFLLTLFFGVVIYCLMLVFAFLGLIVSGLWPILYILMMINFLPFRVSFERLIEMGQNCVWQCSLVYSLD
jgi:hypothetical protein